MKSLKILLTTVTLLFLGCGIIEFVPTFESLKPEERKLIEPEQMQLVNFQKEYHDLEKHLVFRSDAKFANEIISKSQFNYSLVIFYAHWCYPCKVEVKKLSKYLSGKDYSLQLLFISTVEWAEIEKDKDYLINNDFDLGASLVVDIYKYGNKISPRNRFRNFFTELNLSKENPDTLGYPTFMLVNEELNSLYISSGALDTNKLTKILSY